ncbi:hypothetical protein B0H16DRAFT_1469053 [Mycena metata]|uniref:Uncharacterized protein n=1 Tax=Mycena metata TaxID=1033252 RepID=A0AAD7MUP4_9AGAR|nr:hypothetical protein B0H16DRAFT_1469053 [Mycena metata]
MSQQPQGRRAPAARGNGSDHNSGHSAAHSGHSAHSGHAEYSDNADYEDEENDEDMRDIQYDAADAQDDDDEEPVRRVRRASVKQAQLIKDIEAGDARKADKAQKAERASKKRALKAAGLDDDEVMEPRPDNQFTSRTVSVAAVRFGPVQHQHFPNLEPNPGSGSAKPPNLEPDLGSRFDGVRFRFRRSSDGFEPIFFFPRFQRRETVQTKGNTLAGTAATPMLTCEPASHRLSCLHSLPSSLVPGHAAQRSRNSITVRVFSLRQPFERE